jgi:hypothetical protein
MGLITLNSAEVNIQFKNNRFFKKLNQASSGKIYMIFDILFQISG